MKKLIASVLAIAACVAAPAFAQDGNTPEVCYKRCRSISTAETLKKEFYDYDAVEKDESKTPAEKKRSHKQAIADSCKKICTE